MSADKENESVILMLAYLCVAKEAEASIVRKVQILDRFGITDGQIARVCGAAVQSVRNARQASRKKRR
jgi:hypothetical protein